jgi:hypothetical protein
MTREELLLIQLSEELSEMQQEIAKMLRFTPEHVLESSGKSNLDRFNIEYNDMLGILQLLRSDGLPIAVHDYIAIENRMKKTEEYLKISERLRGEYYGRDC